MLARLYAYVFVQDFVLIYPLSAVMFVERGLTPSQLGFALMAWAVTGFVLEAPSGVVADRVPRKYVLAAAQLIRAAGFAAWWFIPGFWGALTGFLLWGVKSASTSGCFEALVYDELKAAGREADYAKVLGRTRAIAHAAVMLASLVAALLVPHGYDLIMAASVAAGVITAVLALSLPRAPAAEATFEGGYIGHLMLAIRQASGSPVLLRLMVLIAILSGIGSLDEFWPVFFGQVAGLLPAAVSLMFTLISAVEIAASAIAHHLDRWRERSLHLIIMAMGALLVAAALIHQPWTVLLILLFSVGYLMVSTVFEARLQAAIPDGARATVSSLGGVADELVVMSLYGGFGLVAQASDYPRAFAVFGALTLMLGLVYFASRLRR